MTAKLTANNLTLIRGERTLFQGLEFALNRGELLVLEGSNGSGKTSLLRAIAAMLSLETGEIFWNDKPILANRQEFHGSMTWLGHQTGLKKDLSLVENLKFERMLRPHKDLDVNEVYEKLGIARLKKLPLRSLSAGQQRRVALARLLLADVPLWLIDEPFTNLDQAGRRLVVRIIEEHLAGGGLCIMAAHQDFAVDATTIRINL